MATTTEKTILSVEVQGENGLKQLNTQLNTTEQTTEKAVNATVTLQKQLRMLKNEMANNEQGTKKYNDALQKAAAIKSKIRDNNDLVNASMLNQDVLFKNVSGSISALAGGFSVAVGVMGLFGDQSKGVQEALLKVQSALAISQGFANFAAGFDNIIDLYQAFKASSMTASTAAANGLKGVNDELEKATQATDDFGKSTVNAASNIGAGVSINEKMKKSIGDLKAELESEADQIDRLYKERNASPTLPMTDIESDEWLDNANKQKEAQEKLTTEVGNTDEAQKKLNDTQNTGGKSAIAAIGKQVLLMGGITLAIMAVVYAFGKLMDLYNSGNDRMEKWLNTSTAWVKSAQKYNDEVETTKSNLNFLIGKEDALSKSRLSDIKKQMAGDDTVFYNHIKNLDARALLDSNYFKEYIKKAQAAAKYEALVKIKVDADAQLAINKAQADAVRSKLTSETEKLTDFGPFNNKEEYINSLKKISVTDKLYSSLFGTKAEQNVIALLEKERELNIARVPLINNAKDAQNALNKEIKAGNNVFLGGNKDAAAKAAKDDKENQIKLKKEVEVYKEKLLEFTKADKAYAAEKEFELDMVAKKDAEYYSNKVYMKGALERISFEQEYEQIVQQNASATVEALDEESLKIKEQNAVLDEQLKSYNDLHQGKMDYLQGESNIQQGKLSTVNTQIDSLTETFNAPKTTDSEKKDIQAKIDLLQAERRAIQDNINIIDKQREQENENTKEYNDNVKKREANDQKLNENARKVAETQDVAAKSTQKSWELSMDKIVESLQQASAVFSAVSGLFSAMSNVYQADMDETNSYYDDKQKAREIDLANGKITQEQSNTISNKLEQDRYKALKKDFERQKLVQEAAVYLETASGIATTWAQSMKLGPILGPVIASITTASLLATAFAQVKTIRAQKLDAPVPNGGATASVASTPAIPDKSGLTSKEENLNTVLSSSKSVQPVTVVKVSEINRVQNSVAVANSMSTF